MKPIHNSKIAALFVLAGGAVFGQRTDVAAITLSAPTNFVVAARTMQLNARTVNFRGASLRGRTVTWQVSDSSRALIDDGVFYVDSHRARWT